MNPNLSQLIQPPKFCHLHLPDPNQGLTLGLSLSLSQPWVAPVLRSAPCLTGHMYDLIPPSWAVSSILITVMVKEHPKCMNHEIFPPVLLEGSGYPCQQWQKVVSQWDFKNPHFKAKLSAMQSSRHHLILPQHLWTTLRFVSLPAQQTLLVSFCPNSAVFFFFFTPTATSYSLDWFSEHQRVFHMWEQKLHLVLLFSPCRHVAFGEGDGVSRAVFSHWTCAWLSTVFIFVPPRLRPGCPAIASLLLSRPS